MSAPLIRSYSLRLMTPPCFPGAAWYQAYADLQDDITEALPYLNSELEGCSYDHSANILLWTGNDRSYAFRSCEIAIAPVEDREEAQEIASNIISMVNNVWNRRHEIEPSTKGKRPLPNFLDIYKLLPGTNCKECGYLTCMAFAVDLRVAKAELSQCPLLSQQSYAENWVRLLRIL